MAKSPEACAICGCSVNRCGNYARSSVEGRSHASKHHFVAERFFGRSTNRRGTKRDGIFKTCPWGHEGECGVYCYECHEELLHKPCFSHRTSGRSRNAAPMNITFWFA